MPHHIKVWWIHTRWALIAFMLLAAPLAATQWDLVIAHHLYYDAAAGQWLGAHNYWINTVLHSDGRWVIRGVVMSIAVAWAVTLRTPSLARWRRPAAYACLCMTLCIAVTGLLKQLTHVPCPWDLREFGGHMDFAPLLSWTAATLPHAHCFPAAHASSGYALVACYFALRERYSGLAKWLALLALAVGVIFGLAQQARGAHFLSHDVWGAFLTWLTATSLYAFGFRARLWPDFSATHEKEAAEQFAAGIGQHAA